MSDTAIPISKQTSSGAPLSAGGPVTSLQPQQQQHMLLLFLPVIKGLITQLAGKVQSTVAEAGPDLRAATGVHFFMTSESDCKWRAWVV